MSCQTTIIWSPKEGLGRATIAAHLAKKMATKGAITILLDLNRYASVLPHQFQLFSEKSLHRAYTALHDEEVIQNCVEVKGCDGFFLLCLSAYDKVDDLYRFSVDRLESLMQTCKRHADHLIVIMPSNYIESGFVAALSLAAEKMIVVMDEDLSSWHRLKIYDNYFSELLIELPPSVTVLNKYAGIVAQDALVGMDIQMAREMVTLPYSDSVRRSRNDGHLIESAWMQSKTEKAFCRGLDVIQKFIEDLSGRRC